MKLSVYLFIAVASLSLSSCVSTKKLDQEKAKYAELSGNYLALQSKYREAQDEIKRLTALLDKATSQFTDHTASSEAIIAGLNKQIDFLKQNNNTVLNQLKDLSVVTGSQAESIRKSLDNIGRAANGFLDAGRRHFLGGVVGRSFVGQVVGL